MSKQAVLVPDIGSDEADVIEILVKAGDSVDAEQSIIVLESAKASMEVPCPQNGTVAEIAVKVGQTVKQGDLILQLETATAAVPEKAAERQADVPVAAIKEELQQVSTVLAPPAPASAPAASGGVQLVKVPDIGSDSADVIEILVKVGERIELEQSIVVLESAKASMEVPNTVAGEVQRILVNVGDSVSENTVLIEVLSSAPAAAVPAPVAAAPAPANKPAAVEAAVSRPVAIANETLKALASAVSVASSGHHVHAGPAVRRLARELGADLAKIPGTGPRKRILKEDVHAFVKHALTEAAAKKDNASAGGFGLPPLPAMDFSKWGEIERVELTKIQKVSAQNLHRAWLTIPHVTQFDEADITELEAFRVAQKDAMKAQGLSLTILAFLVKASAHVLKQYPKFASSLDADGAHLIRKKYIHIGVAVDTPNGLVVPVIRDADKKSVSDITRDLGELSKKARDKKLTPAEMQGAVFSISSLGGIGGTAFTPIVNWPEVAILGVSRSSTKPVWDGKAFQPRLMLPLSLSYDHRVIDGADAARFTTALAKVLSDIRQVLL